MEKQCDVVVIGGGGSGLVAAVRAAEHSGKKVIVLEKAKTTGGGMIMASTMRTFRSKWQKERNLPDVTDAYLRKVMDATFWRLNPDLVRNAILATGEFFDWFCDLIGENVGEQFRVGRYVFDDETGPLGPQKGGRGGVTGGGRLFMDSLRKQCDRFDIEVLTEHPAKHVEVCKDGSYRVIAQGPKGEVSVLCNGLILAIGSWIHHEEMLKKRFPKFWEAKQHMDASPHMNRNYTGDGFALAKELGAYREEENYALRMMGPMVFSKSPVPANLANTPYNIMVTKEGKRFACEPTQTRMGVFSSGLVLMEQPEGISYVIFDVANLRAAIAAEKNTQAPEEGDVFDREPLPETVEEALESLQSVLEKEGIFRGETILDLEKQLGITSGKLQETVEEYNRDCRAGFDRKCFKEKDCLVELNEGPFFALRGKLGTDGAFGGILVNENMQAYREAGGLLPNVYVTGDFASGRFLNMAGEKVQILNDMSWALASGFLAGSRV